MAPMKTLARLLGLALFVVILGFCIFGFIGTFEPMSSWQRMVWRTAYAMAGFISMAALARLLRCQFHQWKSRYGRQAAARRLRP